MLLLLLLLLLEVVVVVVVGGEGAEESCAQDIEASTKSFITSKGIQSRQEKVHLGVQTNKHILNTCCYSLIRPNSQFVCLFVCLLCEVTCCFFRVLVIYEGLEFVAIHTYIHTYIRAYMYIVPSRDNFAAA